MLFKKALQKVLNYGKIKKNKKGEDEMAEVLAFVLYFIIVLMIGIYFFVKSKSTDEKV